MKVKAAGVALVLAAVLAGCGGTTEESSSAQDVDQATATTASSCQTGTSVQCPAPVGTVLSVSGWTVRLDQIGTMNENDLGPGLIYPALLPANTKVILATWTLSLAAGQGAGSATGSVNTPFLQTGTALIGKRTYGVADQKVCALPPPLQVPDGGSITVNSCFAVPASDNSAWVLNLQPDPLNKMAGMPALFIGNR